MAYSKRSHLNVLTTHHKLFTTDSPNLVSHLPAWLPAMHADSHLPASDAGVLWFLHKHSNSSIWNELSFPTTHTVLVHGVRSLTGASTCGCWPTPKGGADHKIQHCNPGSTAYGGFSLLQLLNHTGTYGFTYVLYESTPRPILSLVLLRVDNLAQDIQTLM